jgi:hypothetical protein
LKKIKPKTSKNLIMKNLFINVFIFIATAAFAQDARYMQAMERNVATLDTAKVVSTFQNAGNSFERIAASNPKEWLPLYYQSYCMIMIGIQQNENSKKDEYFDRAENLINKADSISPENSEIAVMQSFVTGMKISVDPMNRGQKLGMQSGMLVEKAIKLDNNNPRAYLMKGTSLLYRPAQYGGGKDKALPVLEEAVAKYKSFKPVNSIMPHWGEQRAIDVLEQCKKQ